MAKSIFVLGAGFTKAFVPDAPLLVDKYYDDDLGNKFRQFQHAHRILEAELKDFANDGRMNLERLMTRLAGGMPYDWKTGAKNELGPLLAEVQNRFLLKLRKAKEGITHLEDLHQFARYCKQHRIDCITFNYDDCLDQALWKTQEKDQPGWHPDRGYGFFCEPSGTATRAFMAWPNNFKVTAYLLKLHGSVNWRVKYGHPFPYGVDAITHFEDWWIPQGNEFWKPESVALVEANLKPEPFMVPPVLAKSELVEQPILGLVWSMAYMSLQQAEKVKFIGYSLPVTDIAAGTLFREALSHLPADNVTVVDYARDDKEKAEKTEDLLRAYRNVFPEITEKQIDLRGGLAWAKELVSGAS
jgi:hypothetical protein